MGTTWKPVQPTEIKDIRIVREVIAQIRAPVPPEVTRRHEEIDRSVMGLFNKPGKLWWEKKDE